MIDTAVSHYEIEEELGRGGMGVVYRARDTVLGRPVALKFLAPFLTQDPDSRERFTREARSAAKIQHNNICTIYEVAEADSGETYIAMAFYPGLTLTQRISAKRPPDDDFLGSVPPESQENPGIPLPVAESTSIALQIAEGLRAAHRAGIVHRDLKPGNIIITDDGTVKILDFGLAKLQESTTLTTPGVTLGTAAYMSPEQSTGTTVDERSDIWAFGVVLYEMLTGHRPFAGQYPQATLYSILNEEPTPVEQLNPGVPSGLSQVVARCLEKDANQRFGSCDELIHELRGLRSGASPQVASDSPRLVFRPPPCIAQSQQVFVGRESELERIRGKTRDAAVGRGGAILVHGESGIGKTYLVEHAVRSLQVEDVNVLWGRCLFHEDDLPYHPFIGALRSGIEGIETLLDEGLVRAASEKGFDLKPRIPHLKTLFNVSSEPAALVNKEQLWDSVATLIQTLADAEHPLLIVIDDLQWADRPSLGLFSYLARLVNELPIVLVGMYREQHAFAAEAFDAAYLQKFVRQLRIEGFAEQLDVKRLDPDEVTRLVEESVADKLVHPDVHKAVYEHTEGHPLFVTETIGLMREKGLLSEGQSLDLTSTSLSNVVSERIQDVITQRIEGLAQGHREILEVAACEGEEFSSDVVARCLDVRRIDVLKILQSLEGDHRLIRHAGSRYRFDHLLIRQLLYESLLPELRQEYHRLIADVLIEHHADEDEHARGIASHLAASGRRAESATHLLKAADRSNRLHAPEEALQTYRKLEQVVEDHPDQLSSLHLRLREGLGEVLSSLGQTQEAMTHFHSLLQRTRTDGDTEGEIRAQRKLAECLRLTGQIDDASIRCTAALRTAEQSGDKREELNSLQTLALIVGSRGEYDRTIELSQRALRIAADLDDHKSQSTCLNSIGDAYWHQGRFELAMEYFNRAIEIQRSIGDRRGLGRTLNFVALVYWRLGEHEESLERAFESIEIKKSISDTRAIPGTLNIIGDIYRELFELGKARNYHNESLRLARKHHNKGATCDNLRDLGKDHVVLGDYQTALDFYEEALSLAQSSGLLWYETRTCISLAELHALLFELGIAREFSDRGLTLARSLGAEELITEALWMQAIVASGEEDLTNSDALFKEARERAAALGHKTMLWQLCADHAEALRRGGRQQESTVVDARARSILATIVDRIEDPDLKASFLKAEKVNSILNETSDPS